MAKLKEILKGVGLKGRISDIAVKRIVDDSRIAAEGDAFIAVKGHSADGHDFISKAIGRGVKVVLAERDFESPEGVIKIIIPGLRSRLPGIADNFYKDPSKDMIITGVTGTNGKTTITYLIEGISKASGIPAGVIGTINYRFAGKSLPSKNTTPGVLELSEIFSGMRKDGIRQVVMEVSSHSLDQGRVAGISFDAAIFTNITNEHLDYHKNFKDYFKAKSRIFELLKDDGVAILNIDDRNVAGLKRRIKKAVLTYGLKGKADIAAADIKLSLNGSGFGAVTPKGRIAIETKLVGIYNVSNILAAIAAALAVGMELRSIKKGIESVTCVPGRLESIDVGQPYKVFVDYAHTEDALYNMLSLLRSIAKDRIITVFGCGGNRDKTKRPLMGRVACRFSDKVIITSDNPRFEEPQGIIAQIEKGVRGRFSNYDIVSDRRQAIESALSSASKGDIVVIAGKGHEKYQVIKDKVMPFDDREIAQSLLKKRYEG